MTTFDFTAGAREKICAACGELFYARQSYYRKCYACYRREKEQEVWEEAYRAGYFAGRAHVNDSRVQNDQLDDATLKELITFVHPDRNPDRVEQATKLTAKLNGMRGKKK